MCHTSSADCQQAHQHCSDDACWLCMNRSTGTHAWSERAHSQYQGHCMAQSRLRSPYQAASKHRLGRMGQQHVQVCGPSNIVTPAVVMATAVMSASRQQSPQHVAAFGILRWFWVFALLGFGVFAHSTSRRRSAAASTSAGTTNACQNQTAQQRAFSAMRQRLVFGGVVTA